MKRLLFIAFMTMFIAGAANAQNDCCGKKKDSKECCKGKKCCEGEAQAAAPKAVSFEFNQPSGMRMFADNEGNRYTTPGELSLKKEADGNDHVTFLELDWYPPISLEKDTFSVGITVSIRWSKSKNEWYNYSWTLASNLTCKTNTISPQLYTPYLYTFNY